LASGKHIIYQILPRLWGDGRFCDIDARTLEYIKGLGVSHVWYTGILRHSTLQDDRGCVPSHPQVVKGQAGSPYAIKDYYDVDPDLAEDVPNRLVEFHQLVQRTHRMGMKVIIDFVPNHLAREYYSDKAPANVRDFGEDDNVNVAFSAQNNFYYLPGQRFSGQFDLQAGAKSPYEEYPAKVTGNDCFSAYPSVTDWYETVKLNYGLNYEAGRVAHYNPIPNTWIKMKEVLEYWSVFGVDGFRCDMAEMVPSEFWNWVIPQIKRRRKGILFIGEVYNPGLYQTFVDSGFDYLYDKVGLYDTLKSVVRGQSPAFVITNCWQRLGPLQKNMLNFLENHDEQRIASPFFAGSAEKAIPALIVSACMQANPFMLYFGQELGESGMYQEGFSGTDGRSSIFDYWSIEKVAQWANEGRYDGANLPQEAKKLQEFYRHILQLCQSEPALEHGLFFDLMYVNDDKKFFDNARQYAFLRKSKNSLLLIVANFDNRKCSLQVRIPAHAFEYFELNSSLPMMAVELLSGEKQMLPLKPNGTVPIQVSAQMGCIWKWEF